MTQSTIITHDSTSNIVIGTLSTDIGIIIKFTLRRVENNAIGKIFVASPYTNYVDVIPYISYIFDNVGAVITADHSGGNIRLNITADNSVSDDLEFDYNIEIITKTKILTLPTISSITVETANKNKVIVTFDSALVESSVPDTSAFSIDGHTISSVAISGHVVTLTLGEDMILFEDAKYLIYTQPGSNQILTLIGNLLAESFESLITNNIADDGTTKVWIDGADLTKRTPDSLLLISSFTSKDPSARSLSTPNVSVSGRNICFKTGGCMIANFTFTGPAFYYGVVYNRYWYIGGVTFCGRTSFTHVGGYGGVASPQVSFTNDNFAHSVTEPTKYTLDTWHIVRFYFNTNNSKFIIDDLTPATGDVGSGNAGGIVIGAGYTGGSGHFTGYMKEIIQRSSDVDEQLIYNYLYDKWFTYKHKIAIVGDSCVGEYGSYGALHMSAALGILGQNQILDLAVSGYPIATNKSSWLSSATGTEDVVFILTGHNDINPSGGINHEASVVIADLQDLINTIRATIGPSRKIILCTMCPIRAGYGTIGYNRWLLVNAAILNGTITGADYVSDYPRSIWDNGSGYVKAEYVSTDNLHMYDNGVDVFTQFANAFLVTLGINR